MRQHTHIRRTITWSCANIFLVLVPVGLAAAFALVAMVLFGRKSWWPIAYSCPAYLLLAAGGFVICKWNAPRRGPLWVGMPAVILACFHTWVFFERIRSIGAARPLPAGQHPDSTSLDGGLVILLAVSGAIASVAALLWTLVLLGVGYDRLGRKAPNRFCVNCKYDRTGLANDAVCPECGTPPA